ncbi:MAG: LysR family transcriptional regulator [Pusillimonas sp.]|nr:LysR family transcriptional regulator [Pusillimonas sp.]|tara:strand:+ start:81479 stop:82390 length:912 start_codon:yes stop_codon:yes gene_type:complete
MKIDQIDLNLMRVFRAIYEEQSLTIVADQLGLTQPAISYSLARLRELLGDPLFIRKQQKMLPTQAAERLAPPIIAALESLHDALQSHTAFDPLTSQRTFRLTMSDIGEMVFLPPLCEQLAQAAPQVRLEVDPVSMEDLVNSLRTGTIDLAVGHLVNLNPYTQHTILFHEPYSCMVRANHPLARKKTLSKEDFLASSHVLVGSNSNAHRMFEDSLKAQGVTRQVALQIPHFTVLPDILRRSDMVSSLPSRIAREFNRKKEFRVFELPFKVPTGDVAIHWHARHEHNPANRWLRDKLIALFKEED